MCQPDTQTTLTGDFERFSVEVTVEMAVLEAAVAVAALHVVAGAGNRTFSIIFKNKNKKSPPGCRSVG